MAEFIILRMSYDPGKNSALEGGIKFFPINTPLGEPVTINAESPEKALSEAITLFPYLRLFLSVQPLSEYQNDLRKFLSTPRTERQYSGRVPGGVLLSPANAGAVNHPTDSVWGKYPPR